MLIKGLWNRSKLLLKLARFNFLVESLGLTQVPMTVLLSHYLGNLPLLHALGVTTKPFSALNGLIQVV
jgi:hypothetical protein